MFKLTDASTFDDVYGVDLTDIVQGGAGGIANQGTQQLADRTRYLYNQIATLTSELAASAPLNSAAFTGSPTVPTAPTGDRSLLIANTLFLSNLIGGSAAVSNTGGTVVLTPAQYGCGIIIVNGALTSDLTILFPPSGRWVIINLSSGPHNVICASTTAGGTSVTVKQNYTQDIFSNYANVFASQTDYTNAYLPGTPTADAPSSYGDNTNHIITAAYLNGSVAFAQNSRSGYIQFPGQPGARPILQFVNDVHGTTGAGGFATITVTFPITFPHAVLTYAYMADNQASTSFAPQSVIGYQPTNSNHQVGLQLGAGATNSGIDVAISGFIIGY